MSPNARYLTHFILFYTCIEGLVINISYPAKLAFVFKDLAILAIYLTMFVSRTKKTYLVAPVIKDISFPLVLFSIVMIFYLAMPETNFLVGLLALKQRLFYIPLMAIGYLLIRCEKDLERSLFLLVIYAIGVSAFGVYLYFRGPDGLRELGARYSANIMTNASGAASEEYWRVPGTFNSPGQFGAYLHFNSLIAIALLMTKSLSKRWKLITALSLTLTLLAILCSGSRAPFVLLSASVALMLLFSRKMGRIVTSGITGYAIIAFGFTLLGEGVHERFASITGKEHTERLQSTYFGQLFLPALLENPLGSTLGIATIGARHLSDQDQSAETGDQSGQEYLLTESYFGILAIETGLLGCGIFMWASILIGTGVLRLRKSFVDSTVAMPCYALIVYVLSTVLILPISTAIDHAPMNTYFWFSIGILAKVAELARKKRLEAQKIPNDALYQPRMALR